LIERPEREEAISASSAFPSLSANLPNKGEDEDEDENGNRKNKKAFIPAKQRMKALSESRTAHADGLASSFS
jgi:hypothetical protein